MRESARFATIFSLFVKFRELHMLALFRKYQKYIYIAITVVIVISFSFFGTYSTLTRNQYVDQPAFRAIDGKEVMRHDLEQMALFLGTDSEDKLLFGGAWGPNFLNDGVIKNDLLATGMAQLLVKGYINELASDLRAKFAKEKRFQPYVNPQAKFLSAVNAWNVLAPQINTELNELQSLDDPTTPEAFDIRVKLFLAERQFPAAALRYVLRHQQKQYGWIPQDPNFDRADLSLFGYHTVSDWFGQAFLRLSCEFIMNAAIIAEQKGYTVSRGEAFADLYRNAEISFIQNANNPNLGVPTAQEYFDEQLRRMGLDQSKAVTIWQQVMLFRRLFHDLGSSVFVDPFSIEKFQAFAKETIEGDLYQLPKPLWLGDFNALQRFELYLTAVSDRAKEGAKLLELPQTFKTAEKVMESYPELVERRYLLEYAKVDKRLLQANVGVKETWNWETKAENWDKLKKQFPELGTAAAKNDTERMAALDALDSKTRARVDAFSRAEIVNQHPEWLNVALNEAEKEKRVVGIRKKGESALFSGLKKPEELIALLDKYPETKEKLSNYTSDGNIYYRISVLDRAPNYEVLTFAEADKEGILDNLLTAYLEKQYTAVREQNAKDFKNKDGSWKPLPQVRGQVAAIAFKPVLDAIKKYVASKGAEKGEMIADFAASHRLLAFMESLEEKFKDDPKAIDQWLMAAEPVESLDALPKRKPLSKQWEVVKVLYKGDRGSQNVPIDIEEAYKLAPKSWSNVSARPNGEIAFLQMSETLPGNDQLSLYEAILQIHKGIAVETERGLMQNLLSEMEQKNALSLKYLTREEPEEG